MKNLIFFLALFFAVILQATLFQSVKIIGVLPNIALVLLIFTSFWGKDYRKSFLSAIIFGLLFDVLSGPVFGLFLLTFVCLTFCVHVLARMFFSGENIYVFFGIVIFGTLAYYVFYYIFTGIFDMFGIVEYQVSFNGIFLKNLAIEMILNLSAALLLMPARKLIIK